MPLEMVVTCVICLLYGDSYWSNEEELNRGVKLVQKAEQAPKSQLEVTKRPSDDGIVVAAWLGIVTI